jgi:hypothetical protein
LGVVSGKVEDEQEMGKKEDWITRVVPAFPFPFLWPNSTHCPTSRVEARLLGLPVFSSLLVFSERCRSAVSYRQSTKPGASLEITAKTGEFRGGLPLTIFDNNTHPITLNLFV